MSKIKSILAFAALMLCGGAWAVNAPIVVWDGDMKSAATKTGFDGQEYTLALNGNEYDGECIKIKSGNTVGAKITIPADKGVAYSVVVKYSGLSGSNISGRTAVASVRTNLSNVQNIGVAVFNSNLNCVPYWQGGNTDYPYNSGDVPVLADGSGYFQICFRSAKKWYTWAGTSMSEAGIENYDGTGLAFTANIEDIFIGGPSANSNTAAACVGLKIEAIALYKSISNDRVSISDTKYYVFPSDASTSVYAKVDSAAVNSSALNWKTAFEGGEDATAPAIGTKAYIQASADTTITFDQAFAASELHISGGHKVTFAATNIPTIGKVTCDETSTIKLTTGKGTGTDAWVSPIVGVKDLEVNPTGNWFAFNGYEYDVENLNVNLTANYFFVGTSARPVFEANHRPNLSMIANSDSDERALILGGNTATYSFNVKNLTSDNKTRVRSDMDAKNSNVRWLDTLQTKETEFAGRFYVGTQREPGLRVRGNAENKHKALTISNVNSTSLGGLDIVDYGKVIMTGNWAGPVTVDGTSILELKTSSTIASAALSAGATLKLGKTTSMITGDLSIANGAIIGFPENTAAGATVALCGGTLTPPTTTTTTIYVGDEAIVANLTFDTDSKTVSYEKVRDIGNVYPTTNFQTFVLEDKTSTIMAAGDTVVIANDYATMNQWPYDITSLVGHDIVITRGECNLSGATSIGQTITANGDFTVWFYQSELADKMTIGGTAKAHVGYGDHDITLPNTVISAAEFSVDNDKTAHVKGNVVISSTTVAISTNGRIKLHDGSTLKVSADLDAGTEAKIVGPYDSSSITKIVNGDGTKTYYPSLAAALSAARSVATSENPKTVTLLATSAENVSIPANVIVAQTQASQKLTGTITGTGTIELTTPQTSNQVDLSNWINRESMTGFSGTIHLNAGRFSMNADDQAALANATIKVTDGAQAFLSGGTWNNTFKISGNGYGGETDGIGRAAIRVHDGVLGDSATVISEDANAAIGVNSGTKTVPCAITVADGKAINFYGAYNSDKITVTGVISGAGAVKNIGPGTLTLSAINTFTGGLEVVSGQVNAGIAASDSGSAFGALQDGSWVTVRSGATLDLNGQASLDNNGYRIKSAGTIRSSSDMNANSKCIGALELIGNTTVEGTYFGMSVGENNTATTITMGGHTLTIHMDSGKNFNLRNTTITGGGIIDQTQGNILVFNTKATYDGTLKKNGGNIEIKGGLDLDVQNIEFGANPGTFSSTGCLVVRGKMSGAGTVACNLSLETNATIDASNGHVTATGSNMWFHSSHKVIANVGATVITKSGYTETMPSVTRVDAQGNTIAGDYWLKNDNGVIKFVSTVATVTVDGNTTKYASLADAVAAVGAGHLDSIVILVDNPEMPAGYFLVDGKISSYSERWGAVPAMFTWHGTSSDFHAGYYKKFDVTTGADASPILDINGDAQLAANTLPEWSANITKAWELFCSSSGYNYAYKSGYALRFAGTENAGAKGASFNDLTIGGMIVEKGATGWSISNNGSGRTTWLGDGRTSQDKIATWFVFGENFAFDRGPVTLRGEINIDIASGKTLSINTAQGNNNVVKVDTATNANVKFHGAGSLAVKTLNATGMVTLDYTEVTNNDNAYISGTLAVDGSTTIKLPAGAQIGSTYKLATSITGELDDLNILVGGESVEETIHWTISDGSIVANDASEFQAIASVGEENFISLNKAIQAAVNSECKTLVLLADIEGGNRIVPSGVVVDTNGHSISGVIILRNGAYILEGTGENKKAKIDGISTSFDATFDDPAHPTDLKYKRYTNVTLQYDSGDQTWKNTDDGDNTTTGVCLNRHPYLNYIANTTWFQDTDDLTIAVAGVMPSANSTIFVHMGSTNSGSQNGLFIATGTNDTQVVVGYNNGTKAYLIDDMIVPNARQCRHSYVVTKHDTRDPEHPEANPVTTTFTIYLDGLKWKSKTFNWFQIVGGFQVGKAFGAAMAAGNEAQGTITAGGVANNETTSYVNYLRAYDRVISQAEISRYADDYRYDSPRGSYEREISADGNWVSENAWVEKDSSASKPASDGNVVLTATHSEGDEALAKTITINLEDAVEYEKLTLKGDSMIFQRENQTAKPIKSICTVISTSVTLKEGAIDLTAGPTIIAEGGKLIFDFSSLTEAEVAAHPLSEKVTGDIEQDENINDPTLAKITVLKPSDVHINVRLEYIDGSYWVKADGVGFKCQVVGDENGAWDFSNTPIVWEGENVDLKTGDKTYTRTMGSMPSSKGFSYTLGDKHNNMVITMLVDLKATDTDKMLVSVGYAKTAGTPSNYVNLLYTSDEQLKMTHGEKGTTGDSKFSTSVVTGKHLIEVSFPEAGGVKLKLDGVQVASDSSIKWTGGGNQVPCGIIRFGSHADTSKTYVANGTVYYSIDIDCTKSNSIENPTAQFEVPAVFAGSENADKAQLIMEFLNADGQVVIPGAYKVDGGAVITNPAEIRELASLIGNNDCSSAVNFAMPFVPAEQTTDANTVKIAINLSHDVTGNVTLCVGTSPDGANTVVDTKSNPSSGVQTFTLNSISTQMGAGKVLYFKVKAAPAQ